MDAERTRTYSWTAPSALREAAMTMTGLEFISRALDSGQPEVYAPLPWGPIMQVIRNLPRFVMRRIKF